MRNWRDTVVVLEPDEGTKEHARLLRERRIRFVSRRIAVLGAIGLLVWGVHFLANLGREVERQADMAQPDVRP